MKKPIALMIGISIVVGLFGCYFPGTAPAPTTTEEEVFLFAMTDIKQISPC